MAGAWNLVATPNGFIPGTMLLLTDGSVMCHQSATPNWKRLQPDDKANYANGTWSDLSPLPDDQSIPVTLGGPTNAPRYFYSAILRDGKVFVSGGEYNAGNANADITSTQVFDPAAGPRGAWQVLKPPGAAQPWPAVGDAPGCVLEDGRVLLGSCSTAQALTSIFDLTTGHWVDAGASGPKHDSASEETWTLLPNGSVLVAECDGHNAAERYVPDKDAWVDDGPTAGDLVEQTSSEIGPAILLMDGRVFAIGATGITNLYTPGPTINDRGTWVPGPPIPRNPTQGLISDILIAKDAPAALLPNGRVLFTASPTTANCANDPNAEGFCGPTFFFEFDPDSSSVSSVPAPWVSTDAAFCGRMLLLPTGEVLFASDTAGLAIYRPDGTADIRWAPTILSAPAQIKAGSSASLQGTQFNGLSQAVAYGDDASMATNYPIVTLTKPETGSVVFARTFGFSTMAVATGPKRVSTQFSVPITTPPGAYDLRVTANGISSIPQPIVVTT